MATDPALALLGLAVFVFPGAAWALALAPGLGWLRGGALAALLAFTVAPAAMLALSLLFDVPFRVGTVAALAVAVGMLGVAAGARRPLAALLE